MACCYRALCALVSQPCQTLSHYTHFTCIKFLHPAPQELRLSAACAMMPRGTADAVKCAVKMLGRILTTLQINRIFSPPHTHTFRSPRYGELTQGNFILTTSNRAVLKTGAAILALTFPGNSPSLDDMRWENWLNEGRIWKLSHI